METYKARIRGDADKEKEHVVVVIEGREENFWFGQSIARAMIDWPISRLIVPEMDAFIDDNYIEHPIELQADNEIELAYDLVIFIYKIEQLEALEGVGVN